MSLEKRFKSLRASHELCEADPICNRPDISAGRFFLPIGNRRRRAGCASARLWVFASGKRRVQATRPSVKDNRGRRPLRQDNRSTVGADSIRPRRTDLNDDLFQAKSLGFQICRRAVPWGRHHHFGRFGGGKPPPYGSLYVRRIIRGRPQVAPTGLSEMRRRHAAAHGWPPYVF